MYFSYFVTFQMEADLAACISEKDLKGISDIVAATPGLKQARLYTPESASDYYTDDGPSPQFAMQLYFEDLTMLEAAIGKEGHLQALARTGVWPSLTGANVTHQVMLTRSYPVLDRTFNVPAGGLPCSFLVHYPGYASDLNSWLTYYLNHHPKIMKFFPDIREIEIFTRVDWIDAMPWQRVNYMQRNKVVFDSPLALTEALHSSVRHEMRADLEKFPAFEGGNVHYPMATLSIMREE
ncbi:hypothetical protein [Paenibacillus periandrae]|uniref:hypothetical protein n=1 Tax=Paenibacillus periandrae TaxID=1761741 RepID=UPI001F08E5FD|nr:hypothetical protein [Paenibacillus periandrae]